MIRLDDLRMATVAVDWAAEFRTMLESQGCSALTIAAYLQDVQAFASWFEAQNGEAFRPELITGVDLRLFAEAQIGALAPASWNRRRVALKKLCAWLMQTGALTYDPFQGVQRMAENETAPRWLTENEVHRLLRVIEQRVNGATTAAWRVQAVRDQAIVALMLYAGLREFEVCGLDWSDVSLGERKGKLIVRLGKGKKRREVPLNSEARRMIQLWAQYSSNSAGALFSGKRGERIGTRCIQQRVADLRSAAGLDEQVTPHALRHTFAKRMLDRGVPITVVSKLLGHSRLETTARYVQPGWEDFEKAV